MFCRTRHKIITSLVGLIYSTNEHPIIQYSESPDKHFLTVQRSYCIWKQLIWWSRHGAHVRCSKNNVVYTRLPVYSSQKKNNKADHEIILNFLQFITLGYTEHKNHLAPPSNATGINTFTMNHFMWQKQKSTRVNTERNNVHLNECYARFHFLCWSLTVKQLLKTKHNV